MKNPNKFGTCYKLSGKRRNPYIARAYTGKNEYGEPIYKTIGYFRTKTEGNKALMEYNYNPYDIDKSKLLFKDVYELWLKQYKEYNPTSKATENYHKAFKLLSPIHNETFSKLKGYHYQSIIDDLGKKYTFNYLKYVYSLLRQIYKFAVVNDISLADYSKGLRKTGKKKNEQDYLTQIEVGMIYKNLNIVENADVILTLCLTGIRPSELFNITKFSVDFKNKIISGIGIKTEAGFNKRIPISKFLEPILINRYNKADTYLFAKPNGLKMNYQYFLNHVYKPCLKELDIPYKSPKSTRHFFATFTNELNLNKKARTSILGHTNVNFTDETYTHTEDNFLKKEYNKVDTMLSDLFKSQTKN